ncbi:MAG: hypothetical protein HC887_12060 [Desulfobacteraceae bacterium]|nr:hypothetical protein [Desulfobacteraceae bacterium]
MFLFNSRFSSSISIKHRLLLWLLIPVILILGVTGHITYRISRHFISIALERSVMLQTMALSHEIEAFLERCKKNLIMMAQNKIDPLDLRHFLANIKQLARFRIARSLISRKKIKIIFL